MGVRRRSGGPAGTRPAGPVDLAALVRALPDLVAAERLAAAVLHDDPCRLRHVRTVATVALVVCEVAPPPDGLDVLLAAAVLHDIGYAPLLRATGFHPLDGAGWLLALGGPVEVAAAVAHHSEAVLQPGAAPLRERYDALPAPDRRAADILTYADQTTAPDGRRAGVVARVGERWRRTGAGPRRAEALHRVERLVLAVAGVDAALVAAGGRDPSLEAVDDLLVAARPAPGDAALARVLARARTAVAVTPEAAVTAVHAARMLAATGIDPRWDDEARTAVRLLAGAGPDAAVTFGPGPAVAVRG